jgi:filamentous hemagglutinin family protein
MTRCTLVLSEFLALASFSVLNLNVPALAQIIPDATLGNENSTVTPGAMVRGGEADLIDGGAIRGSNLFHSFQEFNVGEGQRVYFANPDGINSILSRITGSNPSNIFGILGIDGTADLFLLNPNGIVFGENGSLDVDGSFTATTANAIRFGNEGIFSATSPETPSNLLTIDPSAFLFTQLSSGNIRVSSMASAGLSPSGFLVSGLRVPDGETLLLVGGNISLTLGRLNAFGGQIGLGTVQGLGAIEFNSIGELQFPENVSRGNIFLNFSTIDVAANGEGSINLYAHDLDLSVFSFIRAGVTLGLRNENQAGDIILNLTGDLNSEGFSFITNSIETDKPSIGGNIYVDSSSISLANRSTISTSIFGQGNAGNIVLNIRDGVELNGRSSIRSDISNENSIGQGGNIYINAQTIDLMNASEITANISGMGKAGDVHMNSLGDMTLSNGSNIASRIEPGASGQGGNINLLVDSLEITGASRLDTLNEGSGDTGDILINSRSNVSFSGRGSYAVSAISPTGRGTSGDIVVAANTLAVSDNAALVSGLAGEGRTGDIIIEVSEHASFDKGDIFNTRGTNSIGLGGDIRLVSGSLRLINGAQFVTSSRGAESAGNIVIDAQGYVFLEGFSPNDGRGTGIFTRLSNGVTGNSGNITINADTIQILGGAQLSSATFGTGNAGNIILTADNFVSIDGEGQNANQSGAFSTVEEGAIGEGGDIRVTANNISLTNGGIVASSILGQGEAGEITFIVYDVLHSDGSNRVGVPSGIRSTLNANAVGTGGNINIDTNSLYLTNGAELISSTLGQGNAGDIAITARDLFIVDGSDALDGSPSGLRSTVAFTGFGAGGNISIDANSLSLTNGARFTSSSFGQGNAGKISIFVQELFNIDGSDPGGFASGLRSTVESSGFGRGGNINVGTSSLSLTNGAQILASTFGQGIAGDIIINAHNNISLDGENKIDFGSPSGIASVLNTGSIGSSGNISIQSESLYITNRAAIFADTLGQGNAGNIFISSNDALSLTEGFITTTVGIDGIGNGGNIYLISESVELRNGSQINSSTNGGGNAGNIRLSAQDYVLLDGADFLFGVPSALVTLSGSSANGSAGSIIVDAPYLILRNGAAITAESQGANIAGDIILNAFDRIQLTDSDIVTVASQSSGGNIAINQAEGTERGLVVLFGDSDITTESFGDGGNITIGGAAVIAFDDSDIVARSQSARGGNIVLTSFFSETLPPDNQPPFDGDGQVDVNADGQLASGVISSPDTSFIENSVSNLPEVIVDTSQLLSGSCIARTNEYGSFIVSGRDGLPNRPGDAVTSAYATGQVRPTSHQAQQLSETDAPVWQPGNSIVEPQGAYRLADGRLVLSRECP